MDERLGMVVSTLGELKQKLQHYLEAKTPIDGLYQGQVKQHKDMVSVFADDELQEVVDKWLSIKKITKLLELWVKGVKIDWRKLYGDNKPARISLPGYPFAKQRYWLDTQSYNRIKPWVDDGKTEQAGDRSTLLPAQLQDTDNPPADVILLCPAWDVVTGSGTPDFASANFTGIVIIANDKRQPALVEQFHPNVRLMVLYSGGKCPSDSNAFG